ncbi:DUF397 domain-containing protein [Streptomyces griseorubiginosus]|uniref:DUF397 domain-containing protein n=1 Tax=Streptomyces griseorubiginosus TaxID=67304 RepID=UPI00113FFA68|nr:DUF397 domain-containing protein [Streptomyces griseorubiginosus]
MSAEALHWFKSTYSGSEGGQCLEVAISADVIHIRDSKHPEKTTLQVSPTTWTTFTTALK